MTREEAVKWLKQIKIVGYEERLLNHTEAIDMAIHALKQEPCEDAISRQEAIACCRNELEEEVEDRLRALPSVTPTCSCSEIPNRSDNGEDYRKGWHDAIGKALDEAYDIVDINGERFSVVQEETLLGLGMSSELPSVTPAEKVGRWIPVSERLPEVNQRVLVTSYSRVCYAMMISADGNSGYPVFRLQDSLNERVICETTVHSEWTTSRITAWMPLPQPFEPQESEDQK